MTQTDLGMLARQHWSKSIRLRTLIFLRWVAILGQLAAISVAQYFFDLQLELGLCYLVVGISVIGNLIAIFIFPENKRLSESENFAMVMFDLVQLCMLLFLTGGLNNPFVLLILGPVTISATVLTTRSTMLMGGAAIVMVSLLSRYYLPLETAAGTTLEVPTIFIFGNWIALVIAICFIGAYSQRLTAEMISMADALSATQMALAREQKLTDLGGVVAAAAHELGTPLATIKLTSAELIEDLKDNPDMQEDARLIREQADRCRDILRDMGRAGKEDMHLRRAPLMSVVEEAAEPHKQRGKDIFYTHDPAAGHEMSQPTIERKPEIVHGLRNLVQNAVDFAKSQVWIEAHWTEHKISLKIIDDGKGFPSHLIGRIGEPFVGRRRQRDELLKDRPEYEGMGLGLFIAKTLLERSGAELSFSNGSDPYGTRTDDDFALGAIVEVQWVRSDIEVASEDKSAPLGENRHITA